MATALAQAIVESAAISGLTQSETYGSNVTAGNTLIAIVNYSATTGTVTVADNLNTAAGNWPQIGIKQGQGRTQAWFALKNTLGGAKPIVTATCSATQSQLQVLIIELTGICAAESVSTINAGGSTTTPSSGSITTTHTGDFLFSYLGGASPTAGTSGWTFANSSSPNRAYEYLANAAAGAYNATYTQSSGSFVCSIFAFYNQQWGADTVGAKAAVTPTPKVVRNSAATIAPTSAVTPTAAAIRAGAVAIAAEASMDAPAGPIGVSEGDIGAAAAIVADGSVLRSSDDAIGASATVIATAKVLRQGAVTIGAAAAINPNPSIAIPGQGQLAIGTRAQVQATAIVKRGASLAIVTRAGVTGLGEVDSTGPIIELPFVWASLLPPMPIMDDIENLPTMQLVAYCLVYELPTIGISSDNMRANLRRVRLIYQGDTSMLTDNDRRTLFDAWGIEGSWSTAPSDNIAIALVGYAISLALRYNAVAYCRSPLTITAKTPTVILTGTGECDINLEVDAAEEAGQPLTGTGTCSVIVSVNIVKQQNPVTTDSAFYSVDTEIKAVDAGVQLGGPTADSAFYTVDSDKAAADG